MKALIKYAVFCLVLASCASAKKGTGRLAGHWELTVFPTADKTFEEVFGQRRPELQFEVAQKRVTGSTGCNRLSGSYSATGDQLQFGSNIITTKMACPGYEESVFLDAFNKVNRYEVADGRLRLLHDSTVIMAFEKR
jgi:heat shock protein HslJ